MNLKSGQVEQFEGYSQFSSLTEFNHHVEMWLAVNKEVFSKGELVGLKRLIRYAAKIPGVANAKIGTMLKAIHEEFSGNGISRSTFKRMLQTAQKLGILSIYETERKNGSQSSNLYVFNRFPISEPPKKEKMTHHKETTNLLKTEKIKDIKKRKEEPTTSETKLDHTFVSDRVPQLFIKLVKCYFNDAKTIEEYWHMIQIAAYRNNFDHEPELVLDTAIHTFKQLIRQIKLSRNVRKPIAYFYGILDKKLDDLFYEKLYEREFLEEVA